MKHYKLLKDLPTFNAGDIFILKEDGCLYWSERCQEDADRGCSCYGHWKPVVMAYHKNTLERFPNILEDWFEEIEPTEAERLREMLKSLKEEIDNYLEENWVMKQVKSKLTGAIGELDFDSKDGIFIVVYYDLKTKETTEIYYSSLEDLCEDWEDYEEPKEWWYLDVDGEVCSLSDEDDMTKDMKYIGNYFETKEEAERAVEKLKAWKRLKDKQFKFYAWNKGSLLKSKPNTIEFACYDTKLWSWEDIQGDLDLLFGGEE